MKSKLGFILNLALPLVVCTAFINHLFTFLAYNWYAGIDNYSYDVCGLQLVSGRVFDLFPILFRAPLIPIAKNILYLIFEGHVYALAVLVHFLGIITAVLAYRLGCRFHKVIGFVVGMLAALSLPISVNFHHISTFTIFVPLLLLAADQFMAWVENPNSRSLSFLVIITSLCFLARPEALILIPTFAFFGGLIHRRFKPAAVFLLSCLIIYNFTCFIYYKNFGYWGITYNTGWSLSLRMIRAQDQQFSRNNGPASQKIYEYMSKEWPSRLKLIDPLRSHMFVLSLAQKELGCLKADKLFLQASLEAIRSDVYKFSKFTLLRMLGQLDLYHPFGLNYKEFFYETNSGHMWGFGEQRMLEDKRSFDYWKENLSKIESPLEWERQVIKIRFLRALGFKYHIPDLPEAFQMMQIFRLEPSGGIKWLYCGDSNMTERLWYCRDLDVYFYLGYWGQREWSRGALKILEYWDMLLMPKGAFSINIHRVMWVLWVLGIILIKPRRLSISLAAFLCMALLYALLQAVFSDNFAGRFELYMRIFLWLGASCGTLALFKRWKSK
jgi:hypothetical protein